MNFFLLMKRTENLKTCFRFSPVAKDGAPVKALFQFFCVQLTKHCLNNYSFPLFSNLLLTFVEKKVNVLLLGRIEAILCNAVHLVVNFPEK